MMGENYRKDLAVWLKNTGLKTGDTVKVIEIPDEDRLYYWGDEYFEDEMHGLGETFKVTVESNGDISDDCGWLYPFFALEKVEEPKEPQTVVGRLVRTIEELVASHFGEYAEVEVDFESSKVRVTDKHFIISSILAFGEELGGAPHYVSGFQNEGYATLVYSLNRNDS